MLSTEEPDFASSKNRVKSSKQQTLVIAGFGMATEFLPEVFCGILLLFFKLTKSGT